MKKFILAVAVLASFGAYASPTPIEDFACVKRVDHNSVLELHMQKDDNGDAEINSFIVDMSKPGDRVRSMTYYYSGKVDDRLIFTTRHVGDNPSSDADTLMISMTNRSTEKDPIYNMGIIKTRNEQTEDFKKENMYICSPM